MTPVPLRICMLAERMPPAFGGAARQALQLAAALRQRGVETFFIGARMVPESPAEDRVDGFRVFRVPYAVSGVVTKLRALLAYQRIMRRERTRFDLVHLHGPYYLTLGAAALARRALAKPYLLKATSMNFDVPSRVLAGRHATLAWRWYRQAAAWVCMSSAQLEDCLHHGLPVDRVHRIPNGVDCERFRPAASAAERNALRARLGIPAGVRCALFIGTIEADKGIDLLLEAGIRLGREQPDFQLLLLGPDGRQAGESHVVPAYVQGLEQRIHAAGLAGRIRLLGRRENVDEFQRASDCFVFASRSEGFGTVLVEAMASGTPPVALNLPGVTTDIIEDGISGRIVREATPEALAGAVGDLLSSPDRRRAMAEQGRARAVHRFSMGAVAERYLEIYGRIVRQPSRVAC